MTGTVEALIELFAFAVQCFIQLVAWLLKSLGFAVGQLADKPQKGEERFSSKRLLIASLPLAVLTMFVILPFYVLNWRAEVRQEKENQTKELVEKNVERLAANVGDDGELIRHPGKLLNVDDAWGNPLYVDYNENLMHVSVRVGSNGVDQLEFTNDDVSSSKNVPRRKKVIAQRAIETAKNAFRERLTRD